MAQELGIRTLGSTSRNLKDTVTWWPVTDDGKGGYTFGAPTAIAGKWEDREQVLQKGNSQEVISKAIVFIDRDVAEKDFLALGDQTAVADPRTLDGAAFPVLEFRKYSDIRNIEYIRMANL